MEASTHRRPQTAGAPSSTRRGSSNNAFDAEEKHATRTTINTSRPPARPSTQRSGRSPRVENNAARAKQGYSASSSAEASSSPERARLVVEVASLKEKLSESELAKSQAKVQLQRQEADIVKLERYIRQLVDDQGGIDAGTMEDIFRDLEKGALVRRTSKQVAELKADLRRNEQHIGELKAMQQSSYVLKLAEEKEALAIKVERLVVESENHNGDRDGDDDGVKVSRASHHKSTSENNNASSKMLAELERLRVQNSAMRAESAKLRVELDLARLRNGQPSDGSGRDVDASRGMRRSTAAQRDIGRGVDGARDANTARATREKRSSTDGPMFHEGQAVECRRAGSESWSPATVDSVRVSIETIGGNSSGSGRHKAYLYNVWHVKGGNEDGVPEPRIRAVGTPGGERHGAAPATRVAHRDGETVIRAKVFRPGDVVLARDSGSREEWTHAEVLRRNSDCTYCVSFEGSVEEHDLHPTMLRPLNDQGGVEGDGGRGGGRDTSNSVGATKVEATTPAEEAELRYETKREELLTKAREALPGPFEAGEEVLAKYQRSNAWRPGVVTKSDKECLRYSIDFNSSDFDDENTPCVFVRPRRANDLSSCQGVRSGDSVLAQKHGAHANGDWFPARFRGFDSDGYCSVAFVGGEGTVSVRLSRARLLHCNYSQDHDRPEIPGNPPPPTKPVRAKKHHEGDIVLACVPASKAWTPAVVTGAKGRGRYAVEWADGARADSLLFMHIASLVTPIQKRELAVTDRHSFSTETEGQRARGDTDGVVSGGLGRAGGEDEGREARQGSDGGALSSAAKAAVAQVRLRQRQLTAGEPVLAKLLNQDAWAPGYIKNVHENGKYDVAFTDGTSVEDLSFLFIRGLNVAEFNDGESQDAVPDNPDGGSTNVGDQVYVLKRGHAPGSASPRDRALWRVGTVMAVTNGRFTVRYDEEEGKPQESRVIAARLRPRQKIRQKAAEKGDAVLALSKTPGRGWMMGAVSARSGNGRYTIVFSDGTEEKDVRFVNLRRVVNHDADEKDQQAQKPSRRAIRQRRFRANDLALARHPETRKWGVVKVLEALPSGRYDLEFLGDGDTIVMGVAFTSMRHLDVVQVASDSPILAEGDGGARDHDSADREGRNSCASRPLGRSGTEESWDEQCQTGSYSDNNNAPRGGDEEETRRFQAEDRVMIQEVGNRSWRGATVIERRSPGRYNVLLDDGSMEESVAPSRLKLEDDSKRVVKNDCSTSSARETLFDIGSEVYVLRRGKNCDADLEDAGVWRPGKIVSVRSNGTFAVEYDEAGAPKEDRIQENRLRPRGRLAATPDRDAHTIPSRHPRKSEFEEDDIVLATGVQGGNRECTMVAVEAALGDSVYRVRFLDDSGTKEIDSQTLRHLKAPEEGGKRVCTGGRGVSMTWPENSRKLQSEEIILAKKPGRFGGDRGYFTAKVIDEAGGGHYSVMFAGDTKTSKIHLTKAKPLTSTPTYAAAEDGVGTTEAAAFPVSHNHHGKTTGNGSAMSGILQVSEVSFNLSMAASAARRTSPRLRLATGDSQDTRPWIQQDPRDKKQHPDDEVGFLARGSNRPGTRNPAWKGKEDGVFWLSLEGLEEPVLYIGLEDGRVSGEASASDSQAAIMAQAYIPVPTDRAPESKAFKVDLDNEMGTVSFQWSVRKDG